MEVLNARCTFVFKTYCFDANFTNASGTRTYILNIELVYYTGSSLSRGNFAEEKSGEVKVTFQRLVKTTASLAGS
jgi:hypothetical protein